MELFKGMDWGAYYAFRYEANRLPSLTELMEAGNWLGTYLAVAILLVAALILAPQPGRRRMAFVVVVTFLVGCLLVEGVNAATQRPRPADAENVVGAEAMFSSFPARAVFLAAFAWLMLAQALERRCHGKGMRAAVYGIAILGMVFVCISQLWFGLHWVTDVLAGLAGGVGLGLIARWGATVPRGDPQGSSTHPAA